MNEESTAGQQPGDRSPAAARGRRPPEKRMPFWPWSVAAGLGLALVAAFFFFGNKGQAPSRPAPASAWTDPATGMEFVFVPGGKYLMGDQFGDGDADERPVHGKQLHAFWIGRYEVTQGEWEKVMGTNPARFKNGPRYPVENVSWQDVQGFLNKMSARSGRKFRLPTEAEWEYACRSGGKRERYCGGDVLDALAWYDGNSGGASREVGKKQANGLGIHDMAGNVWEWVEDWYEAKRYAAVDPAVAPSASSRVNRGGSWYSDATHLRATDRSGDAPDSRFDILGLRLVFSSDR